MLLPPDLFSRFVLENRYIIQKPTDKQAIFLTRLEQEAFYGGAAGGGKSSALLAAALMFVDIPGYSAIIFRKTYRDLALPGALMDRANEWLAGTDARWKAEDKTWIFPSGATITFGYLDAPNDKYRYQGAEFQFCLEKNEKIKTGSGDVKISDIKPGDIVKTLSGPKPVTDVFSIGLVDCVRIDVLSPSGCVLSSQIQSTNHRILTSRGWLSYLDVIGESLPSESSSPIEFDYLHNTALQTEMISGEFLRNPDTQFCHQMQRPGLGHRFQSLFSPGFSASVKDDQTCYEAFDDLHQELSPPLGLCGLLKPFLPVRQLNSPANYTPTGYFHAGISSKLNLTGTRYLSQIYDMILHYPRLLHESFLNVLWSQSDGGVSGLKSGVNTSFEGLDNKSQDTRLPVALFDCLISLSQSHQELLRCGCVAGYVPPMRVTEGSLSDYQFSHRLCGGLSHHSEGIYQYGAHKLSGVVEPSPGMLPPGVPGNIPRYTPLCLKSYIHPYTKGNCASSEVVVLSCIRFTPVGKRECYDIRVADVSNYIGSSNIINSNCGFDELTQLRETDYRYLFSRLRRLKDSSIPLRVMAASNPGGVGHAWVKDRFISTNEPGRVFIPAGLTDNPYLDQETYRKSLMSLDPVTREQLLNGDWDIEVQGNMFRRYWFEPVSIPHLNAKKIRYWDLAATMDSGDNDPDYTVGLKLGYIDGKYTIEDIRRVRLEPAEVERLVKNTAEMDGKKCMIFMEQEPGSSGKALIDHYARRVLHGFRFQGMKVTGSKIVRAQPVSAASEQGQIRIVKAGWNDAFFEEVELFPNGIHDDQVDAFSGAFSCINPSANRKLDMSAARGFGGLL